jgi:hypothetical protein
MRQVLARFWWGNLREGDHLEDPGVGGRIMLKWVWIDLAEDRTVGGLL